MEKGKRGLYRKVLITTTDEQTRTLGEKLAQSLLLNTNNFPRLLALYGELGSGKTTFVQGLAEGLGIAKRIISPTFIIVRTYKIELKAQRAKRKTTTQKLKRFYHVDLYRIEHEAALDGLGLQEILNDPQNVVAIEWAERLGELLPKERLDIRFEYLDEEKRKIAIDKS